MNSNNNAKKIILIAISIVFILLIVNIGLIVRINQLAYDRQKMKREISDQQEIISRYKSSSENNLEDSSSSSGVQE